MHAVNMFQLLIQLDIPGRHSFEMKCIFRINIDTHWLAGRRLYFWSTCYLKIALHVPVGCICCCFRLISGSYSRLMKTWKHNQHHFPNDFQLPLKRLQVLLYMKIFSFFLGTCRDCGAWPKPHSLPPTINLFIYGKTPFKFLRLDLASLTTGPCLQREGVVLLNSITLSDTVVLVASLLYKNIKKEGN